MLNAICHKSRQLQLVEIRKMVSVDPAWNILTCASQNMDEEMLEMSHMSNIQKQIPIVKKPSQMVPLVKKSPFVKEALRFAPLVRMESSSVHWYTICKLHLITT